VQRQAVVKNVQDPGHGAQAYGAKGLTPRQPIALMAVIRKPVCA
jgi:hypothetical protein